jgi:hypothetical protein
MSIPLNIMVCRCKHALARLHRAITASSSLPPNVSETSKESYWCFCCLCFQALLHV